MKSYTTSTGQKINNVHEESEDCREYGCCIHNPSEHALANAPTYWRITRRLMERICEHGVGHPDPDAIAFIRRTKGDGAAYIESIHGCDGCCTQPPTAPEK